MARKLTVRLWDILAEQESDVLAYLNSINDKNNSAIKSIVDEVNQINVDMESKVTDANYVHTDNNYTTVEKQKLQGIADNANKYVHPLTHNAGMIVEDANKRFVSDTEMGNKLEVSNIIAGTNIALDKVGNNVTINSTASGGGDYVLPTASATVKGGIKVGSGLTMTGDVLSATGGGGSVDLTKVSTNIVPTTNSTLDIGSPTNRFKTLYCDEAKLSTNTLYIGDVPVLGTDNGNIMVKADPNQNLSVKTTGMGNLGIHSSNITEMLSDGVGGGVNVKAMGTNGTVNITSASGRIEMTAPTINMSGNTTTGNLTIGGNLTVQGTTTTVDSANLSIADNIVELNKGETGQGVSKLQAGIKIKRGDLQDQHIVFDEASDRWKVGEGTSLKNITTDDMIPTKVSQLTNDSGYLTTLPTHNHNELYYSKAEVDGKIPVIDVNKQYVDTQDTLLDGKITENTNKIGDLSILTTTQKGSLVGAVNEVDDEIGILSVDRGYLKPILKYNISLNTLIENGKYAINSPLDAPIDGIGWCTVDVTIVTTSYVTQVLTIAQTGTPNRLGRIFKRQIDNGIPKDWDELATTEKTEILFPYAEGITQISQTETCSVVKCNNQVTLIINCSKNDGFQVGNTTLGFLPVGFRPSVEMKISGVAVYPTIAHGACIVMPTGGVVFRAGQTGQSRVSFVVSYYV